MKEHVRGDDSLGQRISASEVDDGTEWRRGRQTTPNHDFGWSESGAANRYAGTSASADRVWDRDLNRVARRQVQSVQPGCQSLRPPSGTPWRT